jgi:hypothetical protein
MHTASFFCDDIWYLSAGLFLNRPFSEHDKAKRHVDVPAEKAIPALLNLLMREL